MKKTRNVCHEASISSDLRLCHFLSSSGRTSIAIGAMTMIVGTVIMTAAFSLGQFTAGRIITGIG